MWFRAATVAAVLAVVLGSEPHLAGHSVLRVLPATQDQQRALHDYLLANPELDVWAEHRILGRPVDVQVSLKQREGLVAFLEQQRLKHEVLIRDLNSAINSHITQVQFAAKDDASFNWKTYHDLDQIYQWMEELATANPGQVSVVDIGTSYENRPMKGIIIKFADNLPVAFVESGIHAREWIGPASATLFVDKILNSPEDDVVRKYEWHIFPSVNPDGYEHTFKANRNWRKTRSRNFLIFRGADANRNWPFHWMEAGTTSLPFDESYGGPRSESEAETRNLRKYVDSLTTRMHVYVSLHSYSQLLMFPWGYTSEHASTHDKLYEIAAKAIKAVTAVSGTHYDYGNIADTIYPASGDTIDYVFSKCVPYPFVFELRDNGQYGFLLPPEQIEEAATEAWEGVRVIVDEAFQAGVPEKNPTSC